jgi:exonuclease SbcC
MIPRTLELRNFLSYGDSVQTIDFKDYNLICLSGKNGNGKSALLDALTWALWGQARKTTGTIKADEGLIRLGQSRMMVCLTFNFANGIYRVRREFAKTYGKPYTALDFELFEPSQDKFISLTDKTIRATQAIIDRTLGLDYETFINSAFVRQGQANEFSKKSSKERKQILASILGLSQYDQLQHQALEHARVLNDEKRGMTALHDQYVTEVAKEATVQEGLTQHQTTLAGLLTNIDAYTKQQTAYEQALAACLSTKQQLHAKQQELLSLQQQAADSKGQLLTLRTAWQQTHALALHLPDVNVLHDTKKRLLQEEKELLAQQRTVLELQAQTMAAQEAHQKRVYFLKQSLEAAIQEQTMCVHKQTLAIQHHQSLMAQQESQRTQLEQKLKQLTLERQKITQQLQALPAEQATLAAATTQFEKRRTFYQTLVQRGNWTQQTLDDLTNKQKVINDRNNPACPLCEQLLTVKRKQFLGQQFTQEESMLTHRLARIGNLLKKLKRLLLEQHNHVQALTEKVETLKQADNQRQEIEKQLKALEQEQIASQNDGTTHQIKMLNLVQEQQKAQQLLQQITASMAQSISQDIELTALTATLARLEQEKASLPNPTQRTQPLQQKLNAIEQQLQQYQSLRASLEQQQNRNHQIHQLCRELKAIKNSIAQHEQHLLALAPLEIQEQQLQQALQVLRPTLAQHTTQKDQCLQTIGSLEHELKRLTGIKVTMQDQEKKIASLDEGMQDYQILATAFSKNGIQALLIEEAIPEIEQEANHILSRLTNNQAQIFIESLRDLKSGGVKETLDIQIADTAGIRPYEMYSGGEAFRVDFALRIAISKLLARRAGTALQTLIIDEGFGSQDEDGLTAIMEAIYAIQADFAKIIVVSHLPEFKHNFPVHFIVDKGPTGSIVNVEERG